MFVFTIIEEPLLSNPPNLQFAVGNETATTNVQLGGGWSDLKKQVFDSQKSAL